MTSADTVANATLAGVTIYTENVEKILSKKLINITPPQSTGNWGSGPKDTKIVDLLRIETRFSIRGTIDTASQATLEAAFNAGGVMAFVWDSATHQVNVDKLAITKPANIEDAHRQVMITMIVGIDL